MSKQIQEAFIVAATCTPVDKAPRVKTLVILSMSFALATCGGGAGGGAPPAHFAYVANSDSGNVSQYSIESDGSLTSMATPTVEAGTHPQLIVVDPSGKQVIWGQHRNSFAMSQRVTGSRLELFSLNMI